MADIPMTDSATEATTMPTELTDEIEGVEVDARLQGTLSKTSTKAAATVAVASKVLDEFEDRSCVRNGTKGKGRTTKIDVQNEYGMGAVIVVSFCSFATTSDGHP